VSVRDNEHPQMFDKEHVSSEKLDLSKPCYGCVHHEDSPYSMWFKYCFHKEVRSDAGTHDPVYRDIARGRYRLCGPSGKLFKEIKQEPEPVKKSLWQRIFG
jgi:hypothetical protein